MQSQRGGLAPRRGLGRAVVQALRPAPGQLVLSFMPCRRSALHHPRQGLRPWTRKGTKTVPVCPLSCLPTPMPVSQAQT